MMAKQDRRTVWKPGADIFTVQLFERMIYDQE